MIKISPKTLNWRRKKQKIASAIDKKTGALDYETTASYLIIILKILPIDLLGNLIPLKFLKIIKITLKSPKW